MRRNTIVVTGLEVANFMIEQGCEMIDLDGIPEIVGKAKMIFRGERIYCAYGKAMSRKLPPLTASQFDRLVSMVAILSCAKKWELIDGAVES